MRVVTVSFFAVLVTIMMLLTARFWGLGKPYYKLDNEFFDTHLKSRPWIFIPPGNEKLRQQFPHAFLWVNIKENLQHVLLTDSGEQFADWLKAHENADMLWNIESNVAGINNQIASFMTDADRAHVLIASDYGPVTHSIKREKPLFAYGSSEADRVRLGVLEAMFILPSTPFHADFYVGPLTIQGVSVIDPKIMAEMKRRFKPVILGPLKTQQEIDTAARLKADGLYITQAGFAVPPIAY